jgi:hypothetical protein
MSSSGKVDALEEEEGTTGSAAFREVEGKVRGVAYAIA